MSAGLDRDAAREVLAHTDPRYLDETLEALVACVRPAQPQGIDPGAVLAAIDRVCRDDLSDYYGDVRQRMHEAVLALPRPVEGVVITREEVALVREALPIGQESLDDYADQFSDVDARLDAGATRAAAAGMRALAARLEAAS